MVWIVIRHRGDRQNLARIDVHHHRRGTTRTSQCVFDQILNVGVECQFKSGTHSWLGVVAHAGHSAFLILHQYFPPFRTTQQIVHRGFNTSDAFLISNVMVEAPGGGLRNVTLLPLLEISDDMTRQRTIRILPLRPDTQIDTRKVEIALRESRELLVGQVISITERHESAVC